MADVNVDGSDVNLDDKAVIVSSDCHIGPRVKEDLRPYCPKKYLEDFDDFVKWLESKESGVGGIDALLLTKGHYDPHERLRDLDRDGIASETIFHGSQNGQPIPWNVSDPSIGTATITRKYDVDMELAAVGREIYTRWLADFCSVDDNRHIGLAQLPMWDIDQAIEQATWARENGIRGINFPNEAGPDLTDRSRWGGRYFYHDPKWDPFWAAVNDLDMPLASHGGFGPITDPDIPVSHTLWVLETLQYGRKPLGRMILAGVFERFPNIKLIFTEHMGLWWEPTLRDMDSLAYMAGLSKLPSEYAKENVFIGASFQSRLEAEDCIEKDYWQNCIWGNDYPHVEGTWVLPASEDEPAASHLSLRNTYSGLDPAKVKAILGDNGIRVWNLDAEYLHKVAQTINAPTFRELSTPLDEMPERHGMWAFRQVGAFG